jgi:glycine/D-amino acid oxidase-like deaminating enzyme/nitrite reductase/ring-hydroxylating ferredoxin subunit
LRGTETLAVPVCVPPLSSEPEKTIRYTRPSLFGLRSARNWTWSDSETKAASGEAQAVEPLGGALLEVGVRVLTLCDAADKLTLGQPSNENVHGGPQYSLVRPRRETMHPTTTSQTQSVWLQTAPAAGYPPLQGDLEVDVAVLGGGITGLTTALLLKRDGARVAVVEAARVGSGVTGCTTAKVSALQSTIYSTIKSRHGKEGAAVYADASLAGVEQVAALAKEEDIECDLERRPAFTYAAEEDGPSSVEQEAKAAQEAGLDAVLTDGIDLPFPIAGAVRLADQLQFHPVRYTQGLAAAVDGGGSFVAEGTRALGIEEGSPWRVRTTRGTITAGQVVVATHYPLLDRGLFFARLRAQRSYCIAAEVRGPLPEGMSISADPPTRSVRSYRDFLIVGGEGHETGARKAVPARYERLEQFARRHWEVRQIKYSWSAQDPFSYDHLPVIGRYAPRSSRLFVASGFMKWGLASGTFAAMILSDLIAGRDNPWAARFSPNRLSLRSTPELAQMNSKVAIDFFVDRLVPAQVGSGANVPRGEARTIRDGLGKTGVYRDDQENLHAVSLRCTHLGCLLRFNAAERSWDCPCHGSRFDVDGAVLEGPAVKPLERRKL